MTTSVDPGPSRSYLEAVLPVYFRMHSRHQGRVCTFSVSKARGRWFLTPRATVIALTPIKDDTEVVTVREGETVTIDGTDYTIGDVRPGYDPYLEEVS
jgi:hypothetical protein